jgi:hypothetical protein
MRLALLLVVVLSTVSMGGEPPKETTKVLELVTATQKAPSGDRFEYRYEVITLPAVSVSMRGWVAAGWEVASFQVVEVKSVKCFDTTTHEYVVHFLLRKKI